MSFENETGYGRGIPTDPSRPAVNPAGGFDRPGDIPGNVEPPYKKEHADYVAAYTARAAAPYEAQAAGSPDVSGSAPYETPAEPAAEPYETPAEPAAEPYAASAEPAAESCEAPAHTASGAAPEQIPVYAPPRRETAPAQPPVRKEKQPKRGRLGAAIVALALVCALLGGILGGGAVLLLKKNDSASGKTGDQSGSTVTVSDRERKITTIRAHSGEVMEPSEIYAQNVNATVGITTEITTTNFWGYTSTAAAAGSGFILSDDGYIITNHHVIEGANTITVTMYDGTTYEATLVGSDPSNDVAVLKIEAEELPTVVLGDSDKLLVGDAVVAIGNPLGELTFSLTSGVVSALNRPVTLSRSVTMNLIQTDCAINSGNSGGALFNLYGEVVGITNAKYSTRSFSGEASIDNIGFAIPINSVLGIVTDIIEKGYISKPYVGISYSDPTAEMLRAGIPSGAVIRDVEKDSPAEAAGLAAGDVITAVNDKPVASRADLSGAVSGIGVGDRMELTVYRDGKTETFSVTVGERRQDPLAEPESTGEEEYGWSPWDFFGG